MTNNLKNQEPQLNEDFVQKKNQCNSKIDDDFIEQIIEAAKFYERQMLNKADLGVKSYGSASLMSLFSKLQEAYSSTSRGMALGIFCIEKGFPLSFYQREFCKMQKFTLNLHRKEDIIN